MYNRRLSFSHLMAIVCLSLFHVSGCALWVASTSERLASNLSLAVLNNDDLETVKAGAPAYMLMLDGLVEGDPRNEVLLRSAAGLYSAYTTIFVEDLARSQRLSTKALDYGLRAMCQRTSDACDLRSHDYQRFEEILGRLKPADVPTLYALGVAWAGWIQAHREQMHAVAELSRVEAIMQRVVLLEETYEQGSAHVYLGVMATLQPPAWGGRPELGREHFERALMLSKGNNLMVKVVYAERYARLTFNRPLHDRLLQEVLQDGPEAPGYRLINAYAKRRAQQLLQESNEYF
jgi:hypothetical protein